MRSVEDATRLGPDRGWVEGIHRRDTGTVGLAGLVVAECQRVVERLR